MSTTSLTAAEVMDRAAALMNDPDKTDYTHAVLLPYLNMAIDELVETLEESNSSPTNQTSVVLTMQVGWNKITPMEDITAAVHYPPDLVEIQSVSEREAGSNNSFIQLTRRETIKEFPASNSLMYWCWENQCIKFNPAGATSTREIMLEYVSQSISHAVNGDSIIGTINARSCLAYKTAALCSMFIGENESRAGVLNTEAERALERMTTISNKGRQQIMTRHRPFRAAYKLRGY